MQKYSDVIINQSSRLKADLRIVVDPYVSGAALNLTGISTATIHATDGGPAVPFVLSDAAGRFSFYAADGRYSLTVTGAGVAPYLLADVTLDDPAVELFSIINFGAKPGNTAAQNDAAIQACIDAVSQAGGGIAYVPPPVFQFNAVQMKNNVVLRVDGTLQQAQTSAMQTGFYKAAGAGSLSNFRVYGHGLIDGARVANPGNRYNAIFSVEVGAGEALENFDVSGIRMQDAQDHFIRIIATHVTARADGVYVGGNCSFVTTPAKRSLGGTSSPVSMDAVRCEQAWDYGSAGNGYGGVNFRNIRITHARAESIRTLADLKRGCANFIVADCDTLNMYDCHHSVDGGFDGYIGRLTCRHEASYTGPSTLTNFIEVQMERGVIEGVIAHGGGLVHSGIFITDYGRPQENGIGHPSVGVTVKGSSVKGITGNAYRILNGNNCRLIESYCEDIGGHVASVESGAGRTDGTNPLTASACMVDGISSKNAALGVKFAGTNHVKGVNPDENGQDYLYCPGLADAAVYGNFLNKGGFANLCPNPWLEINPANNKLKWFIDPAVTSTLAATKPINAPQAVMINDDTTGNIRQHTVDSFVPAAKGTRISVRLGVKKNTATSFAIVVQEYDAAGTYISNTFYGTTNVPTAWGEVMLSHKAVADNVGYLRVGLIPAASSNDATTVNATDVAYLRIARVAIGI